jgi:hypothetical protein
MKRFVVLAALAVAALPFAVDAGAKEEPTVAISSPPHSLRPHMVWRATITYTVEGRPWNTEGWYPYVQVTNDRTGSVRMFYAVKARRPGIFRAKVVFPGAGSWTYDVGDPMGLHDGAIGHVMLLSRHH